MKTSKTLRLLLGAVVLLVAVGITWWVIGYTLGKAILSETGGGIAFQSAFGFRDPEVSRLLYLALLASLVPLVAGDGAGRWLRLAGVAGVAAIVGGSDGLTVALFVLAAAAVGEVKAKEALLVALAAGAVVALSSVLGTGLETGHKLLAIVLRDVFFYAPLLFGPQLLDGLLWKEKP